MENKHKWISLHLYYSDEKCKLLCSSAYLYADWVLKSGIVKNFFFIYSKEHGPHFRLRFKTCIDSELMLKENLKEYFLSFLADHPSNRTEPLFRINLNERNKWKPNNTLEFHDFNQEITRYGGKIGAILSERQFQLSSVTILNYFKEFYCTAPPTHDEIFTQACIYNFVFAKAIGLDLVSIGLFFKQIYAQWLPLAYNPEELELFPTYEKQFQTQKDILKPLFLDLVQNIDSREIFNDNLLGDWYVNNKKIAQNFLIEQPFLKPRSNKYKVAFDAEVQTKDHTLWAIWMDFVHLNNNRIGIQNQEESYLAFLISRTVDEIIEHENRIYVAV